MDFAQFLDLLEKHCESVVDCRSCSLRLWCDTLPRYRTDDLNQQALVILLEDLSRKTSMAIPVRHSHCTTDVALQYQSILDNYAESKSESH